MNSSSALAVQSARTVLLLRSCSYAKLPQTTHTTASSGTSASAPSGTLKDVSLRSSPSAGARWMSSQRSTDSSSDRLPSAGTVHNQEISLPQLISSRSKSSLQCHSAPPTSVSSPPTRNTALQAAIAPAPPAPSQKRPRDILLSQRRSMPPAAVTPQATALSKQPIRQGQLSALPSKTTQALVPLSPQAQVERPAGIIILSDTQHRQAGSSTQVIATASVAAAAARPAGAAQAAAGALGGAAVAAAAARFAQQQPAAPEALFARPGGSRASTGSLPGAATGASSAAPPSVPAPATPASPAAPSTTNPSTPSTSTSASAAGTATSAMPAGGPQVRPPQARAATKPSSSHSSTTQWAVGTAVQRIVDSTSVRSPVAAATAAAMGTVKPTTISPAKADSDASVQAAAAALHKQLAEQHQYTNQDHTYFEWDPMYRPGRTWSGHGSSSGGSGSGSSGGGSSSSSSSSKAWWRDGFTAFGLLVLAGYFYKQLQQLREGAGGGGGEEALRNQGVHASGANAQPMAIDAGSAAAMQRALAALAGWDAREQQLVSEMQALPGGWGLGQAARRASARRAELQAELDSVRTLRWALLAHLQEGAAGAAGASAAGAELSRA